MRGVELAIEDANAGGGIRGRWVDLYVEDDLCKPKGGIVMHFKQGDLFWGMSKEFVQEAMDTSECICDRVGLVCQSSGQVFHVSRNLNT